MTEERNERQALPTRVALLSIAGFWAFYFLIITVRAMLFGFDHQLEMMGRRLIVVSVCAFVTYLFYLILRRQFLASIRRTMVIAALLALPASLIHSTVNYMAFKEIEARMAAKMKEKEKKVVVIDGKRGSVKVTQNDRHIEIGGDAPEPIHEPIQESAHAVPPPPPQPPVPPEAGNVYIQVGDVEHEREKPTLVGILDYGVNSYFFFVAWAALYLALCYAAETRLLERRTARFQAAAREAELKALRYQVNPHFLFNTLNSLSSLIMTAKPAEAEKMIMNLSNFFRASLAANPVEDVTLEEEIDLQRLYLDIEAVRFPRRLKTEISVPDDLKLVCVPALILQPLVENAIKHGVSQAKEPVTVSIRAREDSHGLVLSVENSGYTAGDAISGDSDRQNGMGVGLQNVRDRLAARFGDDASCRWGPMPGGGFGVTIYMPVIRDGC
ncbi:MAG: histidine kinase [Sphingobium sp.]|nr:histidine kinase [Sphingobium sp.]MCP5399270.1 histidine kinase [Sphingomonas sp.]